MIAGEALLDALINANILFLICYSLWLLLQAGMRRFGLKYAFGTQLRLLYAVFIAIICAPVIAGTFSALQKSGIARDLNVNLSDMFVAHYLNGGFQMDPSKFETLVLMRDNFVLNIMNAEGLVAQCAIAVFLAGMALGMFRLSMSVFCLWRIVNQSYRWRSFGRVKIRLSERTLVPFSTRGLRNYYIVIPSHMLAETQQLKVTVAHELQHIRQGDLGWEITFEALKPFFFLNPAYRAWKNQVEHLRELNCDNQVLLNGRIDAGMYCNTLLSVCSKNLRRDRAFVAAVPKVTLVTADRSSIFKRQGSLLEQRIRSALDTKQLRFQRLAFAVIAAPLLAATAVTTLAIQSPGDWSQDRLMLSTVVNLDRLEKINQMSTFGRVAN